MRLTQHQCSTGSGHISSCCVRRLEQQYAFYCFLQSPTYRRQNPKLGILTATLNKGQERPLGLGSSFHRRCICNNRRTANALNHSHWLSRRVESSGTRQRCFVHRTISLRKIFQPSSDCAPCRSPTGRNSPAHRQLDPCDTFSCAIFTRRQQECASRCASSVRVTM